MIDEQVRQFFRDQAAYRKENGMKLGRWTFTGPAETIGGLYDMFEEWQELLGKDGAIKFFEHCMILWTEALREAKAQQDARKR